MPYFYQVYKSSVTDSNRNIDVSYDRHDNHALRDMFPIVIRIDEISIFLGLQEATLLSEKLSEKIVDVATDRVLKEEQK